MHYSNTEVVNRDLLVESAILSASKIETTYFRWNTCQSGWCTGSRMQQRLSASLNVASHDASKLAWCFTLRELLWAPIALCESRLFGIFVIGIPTSHPPPICPLAHHCHAPINILVYILCSTQSKLIPELCLQCMAYECFLPIRIKGKKCGSHIKHKVCFICKAESMFHL